MKKLLYQIIRFGFVGGLAFVIDYGLMIFLTEIVNVPYLISSAVSFCVSVVVNYILSVKFVFEVKNTSSKASEFILFLIMSIGGLALNQMIMWFGVSKIYISYKYVKIGATALVMIYNFITRKLFLEK